MKTYKFPDNSLSELELTEEQVLELGVVELTPKELDELNSFTIQQTIKRSPKYKAAILTLEKNGIADALRELGVIND